ncbi:MAG TPA: ATP-binding protein, partial [Candidatus Ozemobacteraceae bacterium]|nr:ATP-binding protein [Candidatus Ozemobacteraceae bacterium]
LVTGARQVGKTSVLRHLSQARRMYVSLDDPLVLQLAKNDPALFFQRYTPPLLIDEIQYAPELLPYIKMIVDERHTSGDFWLTGSQAFHLMRGVSESLAGRTAVIHLSGFSRRETALSSGAPTPFLPTRSCITKRLKATSPLPLKDLYTCIWRGSFPALIANPRMDSHLFFSSYLQTYLQRDIRDLARVGDELSFLRFIRSAAARTGQLLNLADLARDVGVAFNTAKHWLSILETSGLVFLLEPYFTNVSKRLVKTPKLYFTDTGLCRYLTEWTSPQTLEAGAMAGAFFETWVVMEIVKGYQQLGIRPPLTFYRDKDGKEVDLLIVGDGTVYPLEIKKTASPNQYDVRHFATLKCGPHVVGEGGIICLTKQYLPLTHAAAAIPCSAL